jgi:hypothetical protein
MTYGSNIGKRLLSGTIHVVLYFIASVCLIFPLVGVAMLIFGSKADIMRMYGATLPEISATAGIFVAFFIAAILIAMLSDFLEKRVLAN